MGWDTEDQQRFVATADEEGNNTSGVARTGRCIWMTEPPNELTQAMTVFTSRTVVSWTSCLHSCNVFRTSMCASRVWGRAVVKSLPKVTRRGEERRGRLGSAFPAWSSRDYTAALCFWLQCSHSSQLNTLKRCPPQWDVQPLTSRTYVCVSPSVTSYPHSL